MRRSNILLTVGLTLLVASGLLLLSSCGGGGGGTPGPGDQVIITPPGDETPPDDDTGPPADHTDEADTAQGATDITGEETVTGYIDSAGDVDYFRLPVPELSVIELAFQAPVGTEISVLDEAGRVLASGVVGSAATTVIESTGGSHGIRTLGSAPVVILTETGVILFPSFAVAAQQLLIRVAVSAGAVAAAAGGPYTIAVVVGTAALLYIFAKTTKLKVDADGTLMQNIREYFECRNRNSGEQVKGCEFEFEVKGELTVSAEIIVPLEGRIAGHFLIVNTPCKAAGGNGEVTIEATAKVAGEEVRKESRTFPIEVPIERMETEDCKKEEQQPDPGPGSGNVPHYGPTCVSVQESGDVDGNLPCRATVTNNCVGEASFEIIWFYTREVPRRECGVSRAAVVRAHGSSLPSGSTRTVSPGHGFRYCVDEDTETCRLDGVCVDRVGEVNYDCPL